MKEYGFNTTLLHGTEGNNPHGEIGRASCRERV